MNARIAITALGIATGVAAAAVPTTAEAVLKRSYDRPLTTCTTAIEDRFSRGRVTDTFHRRLEDGRHEIYANVATRHADGSRSWQRITCATSVTGRRVVDLSAVAGRWVEEEQG